MRTTLNLDDDVAQQLAALSRERHRSLSRVANDLIRAGLSRAAEARPPGAYEPPVLATGRPLLDLTDVGEALERIGHG